MRSISLMLLLLLAAGCVPLSVYPLYTGEDDIVFNETLLGTWQPEKDAQSHAWTFEPQQDDPRRYTLIVKDADGRVGRFIATIVMIDDRWFLDLLPDDVEPALQMNDWYSLHLLALRSFMRIEVVENRLVLTPPDTKKLIKLLHARRKLIPHELVITNGGKLTRVLFTADPASLQAFVAENLDDPTFFDDHMILMRVGVPASRPAGQPTNTAQ